MKTTKFPIRAVARALAGAVLLAATFAATALTVVESYDGKTSFVKIPQREMTRLSVEGSGRLREVVYNRDELELQKDPTTGQIFFTPLVPKAINIFVSTTTATHGLVLQPGDMPLEQILLREVPRGSAAGSGAVSGQVIGTPTTYGMQKRERRVERGDVEGYVKRMVFAMAKSEIMPACEMRIQRQAFALYEGTSFERQIRLECPNHTGEAFSLTNTSATNLRMVEQHLHTPGVLAVSIEQLDLPPGYSTRVFVVREGGRQ